MNFSTKSKGNKGEDLAEKILKDKGYEIIERNYRYGKTGEIDIVSKIEKTFVFVEVKTKTNLEYGQPEYSVTKNKFRQMKRMAEIYLYEKGITDVDCRIDVIAILFLKGEKPRINHIINAEL